MSACHPITTTTRTCREVRSMPFATKYKSGEIDRTGAISKCVNEMVRAMLNEAAHIMLVRSTKWSWLKAWAMKIARHRGLKKAIRRPGASAGRNHAPHLG
jgi:transposase